VATLTIGPDPVGLPVPTVRPVSADVDAIDDELLDDELLDDELLDVELTDDELAALALAADPVDDVPADAVPIDIYAGRNPTADFLPRWYMPPVQMRRASWWHRWAVVAVVVGFLTVDVFGLCITYGLLTAA
jgi:hypothetical protein